jgi:NAD(P)H-hydrate epimerase
MARRLKVLGHDVRVVLLYEPLRLTGDAKLMWDAYLGVGGEYQLLASDADLPAFEQLLTTCHVVVDALFGTGLTRPVSGLFARAIERVNNSNAMRFALDVPSGLDSNRGIVLGIAVRADVTATFGHEKVGLFNSAGVEYSGQVEIVDIGVPTQARELMEHVVEHYDATDLSALFLARSPAAHKGTAGRVGILAGHPGTTGAALLCARGALRMGAGLVTHLGLPESIAAIESRVLEAMTRRLDPLHVTASITEAIHGMDALVVGPGFGLGPAQTEIVGYVVEHATCPVVLDADALTLVTGKLSRFRLAKGPRLLLPHRGEMARLLGSTVSDVDNDPLSALDQLTELSAATVVMKGAYSFVGVPGKKPAMLGSPCPAMATGGTGDVLAGVVGALLVDYAPKVAAMLAVYAHSRAGALWSEATGADRGMLASELAEYLPKVVAELSRSKPALSD